MEGFNITPTSKLLDGDSRPWLVPLHEADSKVIIAAGAAAIPIVIFFFFDQNVSELLSQAPSMNLKKGAYYHSCFLLIGIMNVATIFGLPFMTACLPHSPQNDWETQTQETQRWICDGAHVQSPS